MTQALIPTMRRTVITGPYGWDRDRLPEDEVFLRRRWLQQQLQTLGLDLLLVYGDAQECGALTWATNFHPKLHWAAAVINRAGEAVLCVPGPIRDVPAARALSFDCVTEPIHRLAQVVQDQLAATGKAPDECRVGVLAPADWCSEADAVLRAATDTASAAPEGVPRDAFCPPFGTRDRALLREARALWTASSEAFADAWAASKSASAAISATERHARLAGAHEVRVLASRDNGLTLGPLEQRPHAVCERGVAYIAVQYLGVWADGFHTVHAGNNALLAAADTVLDRLARRLSAGQEPEQAVEALYAQSAPLLPHPVLARGCITWQGRQQRSLDSGSLPANGAPVALHAGFVAGQGGALLTRFIDRQPGRGPQ